MSAGIYKVSKGNLECVDFKFTRIASIPKIPVLFEVNTLCGLLIYTVVKRGHTEGIEREKTLSLKSNVIALDF